jgi:hypothetical protein
MILELIRRSINKGITEGKKYFGSHTPKDSFPFSVYRKRLGEHAQNQENNKIPENARKTQVTIKDDLKTNNSNKETQNQENKPGDHGHPIIARNLNDGYLHSQACLTGSQYNPRLNYMLSNTKFSGQQNQSQNVVMFEKEKTLPKTEYERDDGLSKKLHEHADQWTSILEAEKDRLIREKKKQHDLEEEKRIKKQLAAEAVIERNKRRENLRNFDNAQRKKKLASDEKTKLELKRKNKPKDHDDLE